jgi:hypothetical protein
MARSRLFPLLKGEPKPMGIEPNTSAALRDAYKQIEQLKAIIQEHCTAIELCVNENGDYTVFKLLTPEEFEEAKKRFKEQQK